LRPRVRDLDLASLERTFTVRASEGFVEFLAAPVAAAVMRAAPRARLHFAAKPDKDAAPLREGRVDLEIGARGAFAPEVRTRLLFRDGFVGVARAGHPLLTDGAITPARYAACDHVAASRNDEFAAPLDAALAQLGLARAVRVVVPGYPDAMRFARGSDLVAVAPKSCLCDPAAMAGLASFALPVTTPNILVSAMWHPRGVRDGVSAALRTAVRSPPAAPRPRTRSPARSRTGSSMSLPWAPRTETAGRRRRRAR
jgi:DNA-binding transcriptional LysR family regulator